MAAPSVAQYTLSRLSQLGIDRIFGVPGDYAFAICLASSPLADSRQPSWPVTPCLPPSCRWRQLGGKATGSAPGVNSVGSFLRWT